MTEFMHGESHHAGKRASIRIACVAMGALAIFWPLATQAQVEVKPVAASATAPDEDLGETDPAPAAAGSGYGSVTPAAASRSTERETNPRALRKFSPAGEPVQAAAMASGLGSAQLGGFGDAERVQFNRQPIGVALPVGRERLITLPGPAALHVPDNLAGLVRIQILDRTIYVKALRPFTQVRVIAELIDSGIQIPLDLLAGPQASAAVGELQIFTGSTPAASASGRAAPAVQASGPAQVSSAPQEEPVSADMVQLTRYAARMLYAPPRLAYSLPGIQQVGVEKKPVPGLIRGADVTASPVGQWRSGGLYVTAVRVTNLERRPVVLQLEGIRGRWRAATAQHARLGAAGTDTDTTAIYLVCDRPFNSCR